MSETTVDLLSGPRGRRLCWTLAVNAQKTVPEWAWEAADEPSPMTVDSACQELGRVDTERLAGDYESVMVALVVTVNSAWYWQAPDEVDQLLRHPRIQAALEPLAHAVEQEQSLAWWRRPLGTVPQCYVQTCDAQSVNPDPPVLRGAHDELIRWRRETLATEIWHCAHQDEGTQPDTGAWWSTPTASTLVATTGPAPGLEAVGMVAVEDGSDPDRVRTWPLASSPGLRAFEITGPDDWASLVESYPLEVTCTKSVNWPVVTGVTRRWWIPDWATVGADYDAVHLSVHGYLTTAGRALPAFSGHTGLGGWNPDATWWLNDVLHHHGRVRDWVRGDLDVLQWRETGEHEPGRS